MKSDKIVRGACRVTIGVFLCVAALPAQAASFVTTVDADLSSAPFTFSFMGSSFTFTGTGAFPDYLSVSTTGEAAVRTVFGGPSTDFPGRGSIVYDDMILGGYGSFPRLTTIPYTNGDNFLGLRVTSAGQNYYGFLYSTDTKLNSYGFETTANTAIVPTTALAAPIPEASTWAMMLAGFGAIGYAMRRRRTAAVAVELA